MWLSPRRGDAILHPHRQGNLIKAQCQGSSYAPYRVQAALGPGGIISGDCSCPVGSGRCKHVAALLLAWLRHPEEFTEIADLETNLAQRSPAELVALIRQMVERYPDLELLLELPTPAPAGAQPQIREVLDQARHDKGVYQINTSCYRRGWVVDGQPAVSISFLRTLETCLNLRDCSSLI